MWRRQIPKRYDVDSESVLSKNEFLSLSDSEKARVSRTPLSPADIKALVDTAINLHSRALEHKKEKRWWVALASAVGGLVGSSIGRFST